MLRTVLSITLVMLGTSSCAAAPPGASAPAAEGIPEPASGPLPPERVAAEPSEPAPEERALPTACVEGAHCTVPTAFAERICNRLYPEVALHLFAPKTPWKRAYVQKSFKAWHVGSRSDMRDLRAGEEVIILTLGRADTLGMGGQAFDVLRWDGTCVSLMEDELSFRKPSSAVPANIVWKKLEPAFQSAFAEEQNIEQLRAAQSRTCDAESAEKEPGKSKCELARRSLSLAIAQSVGRGKALPPLSFIP